MYVQTARIDLQYFNIVRPGVKQSRLNSQRDAKGSGNFLSRRSPPPPLRSLPPPAASARCSKWQKWADPQSVV